MSPRSEISPPNTYGRYKIGGRKAQTMKQSICIHNYYPNPELKQNSKSELVSISSTIPSQQTNISFPSTFSINTFNKVVRSLLTIQVSPSIFISYSLFPWNLLISCFLANSSYIRETNPVFATPQQTLHPISWQDSSS